MSDYEKPLPVADVESRPYWDGTKMHQLRAQRCSHCRRFRWPPVGVCPECHSWNNSWETLSETGVVKSFVIVHQVARTSGFAKEAPYIVARVVIDGTAGNVTLTSNVTGLSNDQINVGLPVRVYFEQATPEITLPKFRAADAK